MRCRVNHISTRLGLALDLGDEAVQEYVGMILDRNTIAFMLYLDTWLKEDEAIEDLPDKDFVELKQKWINEWVPGLNQEHRGDCTRESMPCLRCVMDGLMATADRIVRA